jgi:hypothetical protein
MSRGKQQLLIWGIAAYVAFSPIFWFLGGMLCGGTGCGTLAFIWYIVFWPASLLIPLLWQLIFVGG